MERWGVGWSIIAGCIAPPSTWTPDDGPQDTGSPPVELVWVDDPRVEAGPVVHCADPTARDDQSPYVRTVIGEDWDRSAFFRGQGITIDDVDGDGALDLFVPQSGDTSHLFRGDGLGGFVEIPLPFPVQDATAATSADLDGDGDSDFVVIGVDAMPHLLRNDGDGGFTSEEIPTGAPGCGGTASVADMDLDGDLDLFHGRLSVEEEGDPDVEPCGSRLLENIGSGTFVDVSQRLPARVGDLRVMASGWIDLDSDPWPELYLVTDMPERFDGNQLIDGDGVTYVERMGDGLGIDLAGMGLGLGDLNDDGTWDLVVPGIDEIAVLASEPNLGLWVDHSAHWSIMPARAEGQSWGWAGNVDDLDNDGRLDIAMSYGGPAMGITPPQEPDEVYRGIDDGFERVGQRWGMADDWPSRGIVLADLDGNGWLDLVKREFGGRVGVYVAQCGVSHWLSISLVGPPGNPDAIGATVRVEADGRTQQRAITAGSTGYASSGPPVAHFGLGAFERVDTIEVVWPGGETTHHPGLEADRSVVVRFSPD